MVGSSTAHGIPDGADADAAGAKLMQALGVRSSINTTLSQRKHHTLPKIILVSKVSSAK
jgi:sulfopyruvate decarboxylase TPP-binding subunit